MRWSEVRQHESRSEHSPSRRAQGLESSSRTNSEPSMEAAGRGSAAAGSVSGSSPLLAAPASLLDESIAVEWKACRLVGTARLALVDQRWFCFSSNILYYHCTSAVNRRLQRRARSSQTLPLAVMEGSSTASTLTSSDIDELCVRTPCVDLAIARP
eukprot:scaffold10623_cov139-Isochrysis_galbana.AAC.10